MHFLVSPFGSAGDVYPVFGLALELEIRGHDVTLLVNPYFEALVRRHGLSYVPLGTREQFLACVGNADAWHPTRGFRHVYRSLVVPAVRQQYDLLVERYEPGRTVVLANSFGLGARFAQEKRGLPVVSVHLQPTMMWSNIDPPHIHGLMGPRWVRNIQCRVGERLFIGSVVLPGLNAWRRKLGLPPVKRLTTWWHSPDGVICLFPDWFYAPQPDWPSNVVQTNFPLWDEPGEAPLSADADAFLRAGEPRIAFTPGSANMFGRSFFTAAAEACRLLKRRGIFLSRFAEHIPKPLPEDIVHFSYLPFSELLTQVAAAVHHGAIGTMAQRLAAGVPQLIMPLAHDQFDNAARVAHKGAGDWLLERKFTGPRVARKLASLLSSAEVKRSCQTLAAKLAAKDGYQRTAQALEQWCERRALASGARAALGHSN